jgi:tRNA (guanine-N7-)-methyltransferase
MTKPARPIYKGRNFYGRIKGKTLKPVHRQLLDDDLGRLAPPNVSFETNPAREPVDPKEFFDDGRPLWLEVGFGGGEHLAHQAQQNPDVGIVGCEPFINGVAMLLAKLSKLDGDSVRIHPGDVRDLFEVLPEACLERAFLLYPDPWHKTRHHRRRFVTPEYLHALARVLKPGSIFRIATDIPDYVRQTMIEVPMAGFTCLTPEPADWDAPWDDWITTRYEQKALREGRKPHYLTFQRA